MIGKLRRKLVVASMFSLFVVLFVILGAICLLSFRKLEANADGTLAILAENNGTFPQAAHGKEGEPQKKLRPFSPELPYESRYFTVLLRSGDGSPVSVDTGKIAAIDDDTAVAYAQRVWRAGRESGFLGDYRYIACAAGEESRVIFLDCGRSLDTFRSFVLIGSGVAAAGLLAVFLLVVFLSGRIVKPFSETYEKQRRFITDAGHELKTPLTIIDADAEVLRMDLGDNEWLEDIQNQTGRLAELTQSLVLLSRMEEEQPRVQMIQFPLSDVAEETVEAFQALAKTQNKSLSWHIQPMVSLAGDEKALRQLLGILLDNAVKYSDQGGEITLRLDRQKSQVRLVVYNTADSVPREELGRLFDRFYRADQSRNSQTGGYGLGLSIAAAIVSAHRGKITASTEDQRSLTITVTLPAG